MSRRLSVLSCALALLLAPSLACGPGTSNTACGADGSQPVAGAACEPDGQVCDAAADPCISHAALECKAGRWEARVVEPIDCDTGAPTTGTDTSAGSTGAGVVPCSASLPPEGSACAMEGEVCSPGASECDPFSIAYCTGGVWQHGHAGPGDPRPCEEPVACDPQNIPTVGSSCAMEGQFCSPGCEDPCSFCNVVQCENGSWQGLEVFPANCLDCDTLCTFVVPAACSGGPPEQGDCVAGCEANDAGECRAEFRQMLACIGGDPSFSCDPMGRPVVAGCEPRFDSLYQCIGL